MLKSIGAIRICGDYKVTINQAVRVDKYPIPNINDLFTKLTGGVMYTKLDLSHAYQQVVLDEESRKLTTINAPKDWSNMNVCHTELAHRQAYSKESWNNCYNTFR